MTDKEEIDEQPSKEECISCADWDHPDDMIKCGTCGDGPFCVSCCYDHDEIHRKEVKY